MKALKIIALVSAAVFLLSLGAGICFMVAACKEGLPDVVSKIADGDFVLSAGETRSLSADAEGMTNLSVDVDASSVALIREERPDVEVDYSSYWGGIGDGTVTAERSGDTVTITSGSHRFFSYWKGRSMTIRVPQSYNGNLSLDIGAGTLAVSGRQQFGDVAIHVGAGNIDIADLQANTVQADVNVGNLTAKTMSVSHLSLDVGTGDANISGLTGSADLSVSMGKVSLTYDRLTGNITADIKTGDADLRIPSDASAALDLTADMGSVSQNLGSGFIGNSSDGRVSGTLNGGEYKISGTVSMGSLTVASR